MTNLEIGIQFGRHEVSPLSPEEQAVFEDTINHIEAIADTLEIDPSTELSPKPAGSSDQGYRED